MECAADSRRVMDVDVDTCALMQLKDPKSDVEKAPPHVHSIGSRLHVGAAERRIRTGECCRQWHRRSISFRNPPILISTA